MSDILPDGPFLLVTVGTDHHPFERLVQWADEWSKAHPVLPCFVQSGTSRPPDHAPHVDYLPYPDLMEAMESAVGVISHGGPATIMQVRSFGRLPIVVPRRHQHGEHVDDHQYRFATKLAALGELELVETGQEFHRVAEELEADPDRYRLGRQDAEHVTTTIREFERAVTTVLRKRRRWR